MGCVLGDGVPSVVVGYYNTGLLLVHWNGIRWGLRIFIVRQCDEGGHGFTFVHMMLVAIYSMYCDRQGFAPRNLIKVTSRKGGQSVPRA